MTIKSCFSLVEEAKQKIKSINFKNAMKLHDEGETIFIDLRDIRELEKNGKIKKRCVGWIYSYQGPKDPLEVLRSKVTKFIDNY